MNNYRVSFFKREKEKDSNGKMITVGEDKFLCSVYVDDYDVGADLTITAKAFRQAPINALYANVTKVEKV